MTRDDIIRMAKQAAEETGTLVPTEWNDPLLERFAALVAAAEREACAGYVAQSFENELVSGKDAAAAIRARGEA